MFYTPVSTMGIGCSSGLCDVFHTVSHSCEGQGIFQSR